MTARDKFGFPLEVGHDVHCFIPGHGSPASTGFIIGVMHYASDEDEIVCIARPGEIGMPVNTSHLSRLGETTYSIASELRDRYLKNWPNAFKPLPDKTAETVRGLRQLLGDDMRPVSEMLRGPPKRHTRLRKNRDSVSCHDCMPGLGGKCVCCAERD